MTIGQRLGTYLRHPTTGVTPDGAPLDAGSAHIMHSNASELSAQNARLIGQHAGPGVIGYDTTTFDQWAATSADFEQDGADIFARIPWVQGVQCVCFGPIHAHAIALDGRGFGMRSLKALVELRKVGTGGTSLTVMAAVTGIYDTPLRTERIAEAFQTFPAAAAADYLVAELDLTLRAVRPSTPWRSRDGDTDASTMVAPLWLWVGWLSNDISGSGDYIHSVSAFEVRS